MLGKLTDRVLALLGLDFDFTLSMGRDPFNAITGDLYLGARPEREGVPALKEAGITHVVSCLPAGDRAKVASLHDDFHALFIPLRDGMHEDIASAFPTFFQFVRAAQKQSPRARVLVHCEVGVSRSATLVVAWLMQRHRQRFFETYCDVRAKRGEVLPNIGFASQLQRLEHELGLGGGEDEGVSSLARYLREVCAVPVDLATLQEMLHDYDYDAVRAIQAIFGGEIPRVVQGARV